MYDQMFNDINTHILVVWQSAGVLVAAFAVLALVEKAVLPIDVASALIVLIAIWLGCHLEDASYWYNRNLIIIANIERQFLNASDLRDIHYYFGKHRAVGKMIDHLRIQYVFGFGIAFIILFFHFYTRVWPGVGSPWRTIDPVRLLPYAIAGVGVAFIVWLHGRYRQKYEEFLRNSPGIAVDTEGISYGVGHPHYEMPTDEEPPRKPQS
jgi:hypothetical protein